MILSLSKMVEAQRFGVEFTKDEWRNGSVELSPEDAIARDLCPETGVPLASVNVQDHIVRLWPKGRSDEAIKRIGLLTKWETAQKNPEAAEQPR